VNTLCKINIEEKKFNSFEILKNLKLTLSPSDKICFFAPSGSGKTTLINILAGLDLNFKGKINWNTDKKSFIFQSPSLFWYKTLRENILYPLKFYSKSEINRDKFTEMYEQWIQVCDLKNFENHYPHEISGGMKQKTAIIRAFLYNPLIIFMDEPFNSIDINSKNKIIHFINKHYKNNTFFLVTHNIDEIPYMVDKIYVFTDTPLESYSIINSDPTMTVESLLSKIFKNIY